MPAKLAASQVSEPLPFETCVVVVPAKERVQSTVHVAPAQVENGLLEGEPVSQVICILKSVVSQRFHERRL